MGRIETLETRSHFAASPIHLDVPHTSGVDWNPNGILRVIGTSKADEISVSQTSAANVGTAIATFVWSHPIFDDATGVFRLSDIYLITRTDSPREVEAKPLRINAGTDAQDYSNTIFQYTEAREFVAVFARGTLGDQIVLADRDLVSRIVIEGRRGNDRLSNEPLSSDAIGSEPDLYPPTLLLGGRGNDDLFGQANDTLNGGAGNDQLRAVDCGAMFGGAGDDSFALASEGSCEFMNGGSGRDMMVGIGTGEVGHRANMEMHSSPVYLPTPPQAANFSGRLALSPDGSRLGGQYRTADNKSLFTQWDLKDNTLGSSVTLPDTFYQTGFKSDGSGWVVSEVVGGPGSAEIQPYVATPNGLQPIDLPQDESFGEVYRVSRNGRYRGGSVFRSEYQTHHAAIWTDGVPALLPTHGSSNSYVQSVNSSGDALVKAGSTNLLLFVDGASRPITLSNGAALKDARINDARMLVGLAGAANQMKLMCADAASGHVNSTYTFSSDIKNAGLMEMNSAGCVVGYVARVNPANPGDNLVDGFYFDGQTITFASEIAELAPFARVEFRTLSDTNLVAGYSDSNRIFSPFVIQFE